MYSCANIAPRVNNARGDLLIRMYVFEYGANLVKGLIVFILAFLPIFRDGSCARLEKFLVLL